MYVARVLHCGEHWDERAKCYGKTTICLAAIEANTAHLCRLYAYRCTEPGCVSNSTVCARQFSQPPPPSAALYPNNRYRRHMTGHVPAVYTWPHSH